MRVNMIKKSGFSLVRVLLLWIIFVHENSSGDAASTRKKRGAVSIDYTVRNPQFIKSIIWKHETPSQEKGLTKAEKDFILEIFNTYRHYVALGSFNSKPKAANMIRLAWSEELAKEAQAFASNCTAGAHGGHGHHGQNTAFAPTPIKFFKFAFTGWNDGESKHWETTDANGWWENEAGHFSQDIWASNKKVGCGYDECKGSTVALGRRFVCHFSPGGNFKDTPAYIVGEPCSKCPPGNTRCVDGALCTKTGDAKIDNCLDKLNFCASYKAYFCISATYKFYCKKTCDLCG